MEQERLGAVKLNDVLKEEFYTKVIEEWMEV